MVVMMVVLRHKGRATFTTSAATTTTTTATTAAEGIALIASGGVIVAVKAPTKRSLSPELLTWSRRLTRGGIRLLLFLSTIKVPISTQERAILCCPEPRRWGVARRGRGAPNWTNTGGWLRRGSRGGKGSRSTPSGWMPSRIAWVGGISVRTIGGYGINAAPVACGTREIGTWSGGHETSPIHHTTAYCRCG